MLTCLSFFPQVVPVVSRHVLSPPRLTHALQIAANQQPPNHLTMTESMAEGLAKPQLDTETGEMVSKSELKKRLKKRAKNKNLTNTTKVPTPDTDDSHDPNAMFKQGFLAEVFKERPSRPVSTRFPPEPNGYLHLGSFDENLSLIEADCSRTRQGYCHQFWLCTILWRRLCSSI